MIEERVLKDLGLTENESKVYLACLELGTDTVLHITKKAGLKRPTCYLALDSLLEKGLVSKTQTKTTTVYSPESPKIILNKYKEKVANFEDLVPYFEAKFNRGPKPKIRYYEGREGLWHVYTKILFPSKEINFSGTDVNKVSEVFPELFEYARKNFDETLKKTKELVRNDKHGVEYAKKYSNAWQIKVLPEDLPAFADSVITEDKVFLVSLDNLFGVLIESEDIARTYKNLFLLAWRSADEMF